MYPVFFPAVGFFCLLWRCHCNTNSEALNNMVLTQVHTAKKKTRPAWYGSFLSIPCQHGSFPYCWHRARVFVTPERLVKSHLADKHESVQILLSAAVAGQTFANWSSSRQTLVAAADKVWKKENFLWTLPDSIINWNKLPWYQLLLRVAAK